MAQRNVHFIFNITYNEIGNPLQCPDFACMDGQSVASPNLFWCIIFCSTEWTNEAGSQRKLCSLQKMCLWSCCSTNVQLIISLISWFLNACFDSLFIYEQSKKKKRKPYHVSLLSHKEHTPKSSNIKNVQTAIENTLINEHKTLSRINQSTSPQCVNTQEHIIVNEQY